MALQPFHICDVELPCIAHAECLDYRLSMLIQYLFPLFIFFKYRNILINVSLPRPFPDMYFRPFFLHLANAPVAQIFSRL